MLAAYLKAYEDVSWRKKKKATRGKYRAEAIYHQKLTVPGLATGQPRELFHQSLGVFGNGAAVQASIQRQEKSPGQVSAQASGHFPNKHH